MFRLRTKCGGKCRAGDETCLDFSSVPLASLAFSTHCVVDLATVVSATGTKHVSLVAADMTLLTEADGEIKMPKENEVVEEEARSDRMDALTGIMALLR